MFEYVWDSWEPNPDSVGDKAVNVEVQATFVVVKNLRVRVGYQRDRFCLKLQVYTQLSDRSILFESARSEDRRLNRSGRKS